MELVMALVFAMGIGAGGHQEPVPPSLGTDTVCDTEADLARILKLDNYALAAQEAGISEMVESVRSEFAELCASRPVDDAFSAGKAVPWLIRADTAVENLAELSLRALRYMNLATDIEMGKWTADAIAGSLARLEYKLNHLRRMAYSAVRTEYVEVIREAPAPVDEPESQCVRNLRDSSARWASELSEWTGVYQGMGDDWQLAKRSISELHRIVGGSGEPISYVSGWLSQWDSIQRRGSISLLGSGPLPHIARDMWTQLYLCGIILPEPHRHERRR